MIMIMTKTKKMMTKATIMKKPNMTNLRKKLKNKNRLTL